MSGEQRYQDGDEIVTISGKVKWFNQVKGFGFITPDDDSGDVFLHLSCLRQAGYETVEEGAAITADVAKRPKGMQAVRILKLDASSGGGGGGRGPSMGPRGHDHRDRGDRFERPDRGDRGDRRPPMGRSPMGGAGRFPPVVAEGEFMTATVKWFNPVKGYGFVTQGDGSQDIFIHMEVLRRTGLNELQPGQAVRVRIGAGPKGPQVADIRLD